MNVGRTPETLRVPPRRLLLAAFLLCPALAAAQAVTGAIDVAAVLEHRDLYTHHWSDAGQEHWVEGAGIVLVRGHGQLTAPKQVAVTGKDGAIRGVEAGGTGEGEGGEGRAASEVQGRHL